MASKAMSSLGSKSKFCPHCNENVSRTLYFRHKRLYFSRESGEWDKESVHKEDGPSFSLDSGTSTNYDHFDPEYEENNPTSLDPEVSEQVTTVDFDDFVVYDSVLNDIDDIRDTSSDCDEPHSDTEDISSSDEGEEKLAAQSLIEIVEFNEDDFSIDDYDSDNAAREVITEPIHNLLIVFIKFLLMFQTLFRVSDHAIDILFIFLRRFFKLLSNSVPSELLAQFSSKLPKNLRQARLDAGGRQAFQKYCCCSKCYSIYPKDECVIIDRTGQRTALCSYVKFPNHPQKSRRGPCNTPLMKQTRSPSGKILLRPYLTYCYRSVIHSLEMLLVKPGFLENCEKWRSHTYRNADGTYHDIYDGKVWQDFLNYDGKPFLSLPFNFGLQLNVDWFQPFDHTTHSEGVIFLTVLNLPRNLRYLQENTILLGVVPGPHEPKYHMNSFLKPFIEELMSLWSGVILKTQDGCGRLVRAALLCVACDVPAARKVCGFVGHAAYRGCSRCLVTFPYLKEIDKADYSNFDRETWKLRNKNDHSNWIKIYKKCNSRKQQTEVERASGIRYSCLSELPYFDCSRMCVVDPMHNLLLGTAKHIITVWLALGVMDESKLNLVQHFVDEFHSPPDIGRVPLKIASKFSGFTAEQWKNFVLYYSLPSLKSILPPDHYACWLLFVQMCYTFCRRRISETDIQKGDKITMQFCKLYLALYGKRFLTPNIHLHGHLASYIKDFGPVYSFWLFPFERLNGILGSYHSNSHNISIQLMTRFLDHEIYSPDKWPQDMLETFYPIIEKCRYNKGSLQQENVEGALLSDKLAIFPFPPVFESVFTSSEHENVSNAVFIATNSINAVLLPHQVCYAVKINSFVIGASKSKVLRSSLVLVESQEIGSSNTWLCEVEQFVEVHVTSHSNTPIKLWFAEVSVFMQHEQQQFFGEPAQVWSLTQRSENYYVPLTSIKSRVVSTKISVKFSHTYEEFVYVIVPIEHKS